MAPHHRDCGARAQRPWQGDGEAHGGSRGGGHGRPAPPPGLCYRGPSHWGVFVKLSQFLREIPLIGLVALAYFLLALAGTDIPARPLLTLRLPSGAAWTFTAGELLLLVGMAALYIEIYKATHTMQSTVLDHILSLGVFIACLIGFLLAAPLGTSTFLLIMVLSLLDVIAGFTVTISSARRDIAYTDERPR